jgi:UDP-glucuronate 4-epimerase
MSITNLRFFTVYGPRGRVDMAPFIFIDAIYNNKTIVVYGDGSSIRDFTYIDDIVGGVIQAIDQPQGYQIINLGRGKPIRLSEFIEMIEIIVGKKAVITYQSAYAGDVTRTHADISKAQKSLGYAPSVSLYDGLSVMYGWYINEYQKLITKRRSIISSDDENVVYVSCDDF